MGATYRINGPQFEADGRRGDYRGPLYITVKASRARTAEAGIDLDLRRFGDGNYLVGPGGWYYMPTDEDIERTGMVADVDARPQADAAA